jgi:hypothetical protein
MKVGILDDIRTEHISNASLRAVQLRHFSWYFDEFVLTSSNDGEGGVIS